MSETVPEGSIAKVLDWVGDDPDRAQEALDVERESDNPRSTLVAQLEDIVALDEDQLGDPDADDVEEPRDERDPSKPYEMPSIFKGPTQDDLNPAYAIKKD